MECPLKGWKHNFVSVCVVVTGTEREKCKSLAAALMTWYSKLVGNSDGAGDTAAAAKIKIEMESHFHLPPTPPSSGKDIVWEC